MNCHALYLGNNELDDKVPSKIFNVARKKINKHKIKDVEDLIPPEDIRNIIEDLNKWTVYE